MTPNTTPCIFHLIYMMNIIFFVKLFILLQEMIFASQKFSCDINQF